MSKMLLEVETDTAVKDILRSCLLQNILNVSTVNRSFKYRALPAISARQIQSASEMTITYSVRYWLWILYAVYNCDTVRWNCAEQQCDNATTFRDYWLITRIFHVSSRTCQPQSIKTHTRQTYLRKLKLLVHIRCQEDWTAAIRPIETTGLRCCINLSSHNQVCRDMTTCLYIFFAWSRSHTFADCAHGRCCPLKTLETHKIWNCMHTNEYE